MLSRNRVYRWGLPLLALLFLASTGCEKAGDSSKPSTLDSPTQAADAAKNTALPSSSPDEPTSETQANDVAATVTVEIISTADFQSLLDAQRGKWVLVDFWGTWCVPCRELLPHTVSVGKKFADKLVVMPVAIDDAAQKDEIARVLSQSGYAGTAYCVREGISMEAFENLEIAGGALPHLRLYDPEGNLAAAFGVDALPPTAEAIDAELEKQLGE